jgi:hypothetical protein
MQQHRTAPPATLVAVLERITYANEQTGYTVARVADLVVDIVAGRLPRRFGLDPAREVQVLCPMHRGRVGSKRALAKAVHTQGAGRRYTGEAAQLGHGVVV